VSHPVAMPHDPIEPVIPDVFMVRGSVRLPLMRLSRNMAIVRHEGELTLVDPIRLDDAGERQLRELGEVRRILRLGPLHGQDDPYYMETFGAELWAQGESQSYPEPKPDVVVGAGSPLPIPDAELFCFEDMTQKESALLIRRGGGLLLTCDAVQHHGDFRHDTLLARGVMRLIGFSKTTLLGPLWLKVMTPEGGSLEPEFRRLLTLEFDKLLGAHGSLLEKGANAAVTAAVDRVYSG